MRLASEPLQVLRGSGRPGPALPGAHAAGAGDGRHPRLRLAGPSSPRRGRTVAAWKAPEGEPARRTNFRNPGLGPCGLKGGPGAIAFHDLRHPAVALAIAAGGHARAIQARPGRSSVTMTLDRYGYLME